MKNILLIAGLGEEYYYRPFVEACRESNVTIYVFDPSRFPEEAALNIKFDSHGVSGFIDVVGYGTHGLENARLPVVKIDVAWYLRENMAIEGEREETLEDRFRYNESAKAMRSFFSVLPCAWVNKKETIDFLSSNKLYQQIVASQSGLLTPKTLISNDPLSIVEFSDSNGGLLVKSLGYIKLDKERQHFLYAQRFTHGELEGAAESIRRCPILSQEYVEKSYEHRVMVIGNTVLSCEIDSQASEQTKTDWRHYDFENVRHSTSQLPVSVQDSLKKFMQKIDLRYGAIDMIETPQGGFVFLEVNPSGQWGWIADLAGLPIPQAVAHMLESL